MIRKEIASISLLTFILILITGCYNFNSTKLLKNSVEQKEQVNRVYRASGINQIFIDNYAGDISIEKSDNINEVQVKINRVVRGYEAEAVKEAKDKIDFDSTTSGDKLILKTKSHKVLNSKVHSLNNDFHFVIPSTIDNLEIRNNTGDVLVTGDFGKVVVNNNVGDVKLIGATNLYDAKVDTGDIKLDGVVKKGNISSSVGDVRMNLKKAYMDGSITFKTDISEIVISLPKDTKVQTNQKPSINKQFENIKISDEGMNLKFKCSDMTNIYVKNLE
ncbi:hypothetical protein CLPU_11c00640 [Gottschalkia purinilytica]|uniref:Adhesin domain-containing protein n=1 Tax=Gottschalkia purinilytica TaxID=1503 RepID=A0A0L0W9A1_GOTPU|nr:hypothetical protein [Gottschalkia purinilytica]KNF07895.1 hypothetical protein CLPU_11c00640 [Gottschalkia purinilytica]